MCDIVDRRHGMAALDDQVPVGHVATILTRPGVPNLVY
jgi:hypothetical protein